MDLEFIGLRQSKTTGVYRLEFDVLEIDNEQVKKFIGEFGSIFSTAFVKKDLLKNNE